MPSRNFTGREAAEQNRGGPPGRTYSEPRHT